ncbi:MAG: VanZ family protein [Myxococcales bacterium]|nr:VanZ family protein [Myxococcales bacterium]MCB9520014.1 VanZ family protein [Myxococcales bacterium]
MTPPAAGRRHWLPVPLYVLAVLGASALLSPPPMLAGSDKVIHAFEYGGLGALFARAVWHHVGAPPAWLPVVSALSFCAGAGALDEWVQSYAVLRTSDLRDLAADVVGGTIGALLYVAAARAASARRTRVAARGVESREAAVASGADEIGVASDSQIRSRE